MADFTNILTCSLNVDELQLNSYVKNVEHLLADDNTVYGRRVTFDCKGEIRAANASALASALAAFEAAVKAAELQHFSITAFGAVKEQLLRSDCTEGPNLKFSYTETNALNVQGVSFSVTAVRVSPDENGILSATQKTQTSVNADGLEVMSITGTLRTPRGTSASTKFLDGVGDTKILPDPVPTGYQQSYQYSKNEIDTVVDYTISQTQLNEGYPSSTGGKILDGERTISTSYDEHNRKVTVYRYDYSGPGAADYMDTMLLALKSAVGFKRASITKSFHKSAKATGEFEILSEETDGEVLELTESISHSLSGPLLEAFCYPGTTPLLAKSPASVWQYEQSGRAVGLGKYPKEPDTAFDATYLAEEPQITFTRLNDSEFETAWCYRFMFTTQQTIGDVLPSDRSNITTFYGD